MKCSDDEKSETAEQSVKVVFQETTPLSHTAPPPQHTPVTICHPVATGVTFV